MIYRRTERFKKAYQALPIEIRSKVAKVFQLFQENPRHPSLGIKKIKGWDEIWEGRIDQDYRFTFHYEKSEQGGDVMCIFRNVDSHDACLNKP
jgi:mRNA interferase RelE/StbE